MRINAPARRAALLTLLAAAFATGAGLASSACGEAPEPGDTAPDLTLTDENPASPTHGETRRLSDQRGEVTLLYFVSYG